jgi:hypothetical protein
MEVFMRNVVKSWFFPRVAFGFFADFRKRHTRDERHQLGDEKVHQPTGRSLYPEAIHRIFVGHTAVLLLFLLFSPSVLAQIRVLPSGTQSIQQGKSNNNGQDPTDTLPRLDLRYQYRNLPTHPNDQAHVFTSRVDGIFRLNDQWRISGRLELPLTYTNRVSNNTPNPSDGEFQFGIGEIVAQVFGIYNINELTAIAFGTQFIFPTSSIGGGPEKNIGLDQYRLLPTVVASWKLPKISPGSFFAPIARYNFDIARSSGQDDASHTSELQFSPTINVMLPDSWFVTLFPGTTGGDMRYNLGTMFPRDKGRLFLPADFMVGKLFERDTKPNMIASLEIGVPIINDYKRSTLLGTYDFRIEARVGFFW